MGRRRPGAASGLLSRVRWGNVGRLVAAVAAVLLIVVGPPGDEKAPPPPPVAERSVPTAPPRLRGHQGRPPGRRARPARRKRKPRHWRSPAHRRQSRRPRARTRVAAPVREIPHPPERLF